MIRIMRWRVASAARQKSTSMPYEARTGAAHRRRAANLRALFAYSILIPLLVLDVTWWQFLIGFLAMHLTAGLILGVIFQLAHVVEGTEYPLPDENGRMEHVWLIHEMETTADFAQGNRWLSWYIGGLNYQIEHHLFPQVCSIHDPADRGIVRTAAERNGVPYNCHPTLRAAVRSHYFMLRQLGRPALEPAAAPARAVAP